jgi:DNA (cytosine-5)-methyltransferase 1
LKCDASETPPARSCKTLKKGHSNEDISLVVENVNQIPDHDLLVGGFPCQDYSVATTLKNSKGHW